MYSFGIALHRAWRGCQLSRFEEQTPSLDNYWRAVILFGRNVASYKFALAKSLIELSDAGKTSVGYDELAVPFAKHVIEHLRICDKQGTSGSSKYLEACRKFRENELKHELLIETTVKLGFVNVIDAFHIVNNKELPIRFFRERENKQGIELTDELMNLSGSAQFSNLPSEVEARWRLVETAWEMNLSRNLITVHHDAENNMLFASDRQLRRVTITSSRPALNGYQKGKCFYCFADLLLIDEGILVTDVDHFFPHTLKQYGFVDINCIWNLVLACQECNRGAGGKFAQVPELRLLERLHTRNEFLISSHHPLRETLIQQTGNSEPLRRGFLNERYREATNRLIHKWRPVNERAPAF
jgi:hypothetical protein